MNNIVIYRLPYQKQIHVFRSGAGNSKFILAPFLKTSKQVKLNGDCSIIIEDELDLILKNFELLSATQKESSSEERYKSLISLAKSKINTSKLDKVVLAGKKWVSENVDVLKIYKRLLSDNPNAFVYVYYINNKVMIGASPELLLEREGSTLKTVALGGTETRGIYSEKERIEHQQIQDYIELILKENDYLFVRHDTSSIIASKVSHLQTPYTIEARNLSDDLRLINCLHPTSAICGLPYKEAIAFIKENEGFDRNFYSGFLGAIDENSNFKLFVNLRCAELYQDGAMLYAGAGINAMSSPEDEWSEINNKMQTIAQCLK